MPIFSEKGMKVEAVDGSEKLCKIAQQYTGKKVKQMLFQDLNEWEKYDVIWACSSILHLKKDELKLVLTKMIAALKTGGVIYTSFKYGNFEGMRNGRYFIDFTAESFMDFTKDIEHLKMKECWKTKDVRPGRGEEKWLNLILQKE